MVVKFFPTVDLYMHIGSIYLCDRFQKFYWIETLKKPEKRNLINVAGYRFDIDDWYRQFCLFILINFEANNFHQIQALKSLLVIN